MKKLIELKDQDYQYCLDYVSGKTNIMAFNNINRIIKAISGGTSIPKGHWIEYIKRDEFDDYEEVFYKCSECGIEDCYKFTYCPNCGARMSEVSEDGRYRVSN